MTNSIICKRFSTTLTGHEFKEQLKKWELQNDPQGAFVPAIVKKGFLRYDATSPLVIRFYFIYFFFHSYYYHDTAKLEHNNIYKIKTICTSGQSEN